MGMSINLPFHFLLKRRSRPHMNSHVQAGEDPMDGDTGQEKK